MANILGIHHVSAICGPPQENVDFYTGVLGLRLVKLTVNYDDPSAYHFYYRDYLGTPGTLLTFFPYPEGHPGRPGSGQATLISLGVPSDAIAYWADRFKRRDVDFDRPVSRDGLESIRFRAPDGLQLELVTSTRSAAPAPLLEGPIPWAKAIVGMESITLTEREPGPTRAILENILGFKLISESENRLDFAVEGGGSGKTLSLSIDPDGPVGRQGRGAVHHIALRATDEAGQIEDRIQVVNQGLHASTILDRSYFRSVYFREPGGVLLELATDTPGFTVDEPVERLGMSLMLPERLEEYRVQIQRALEPLRLPKVNR